MFRVHGRHATRYTTTFQKDNEKEQSDENEFCIEMKIEMKTSGEKKKSILRGRSHAKKNLQKNYRVFVEINRSSSCFSPKTAIPR